MALADFFTRPAIAGPTARNRLSLTRMLAVRRSRQALTRLDARALDDIGISPECARLEADRPVWDVPDHWRR